MSGLFFDWFKDGWPISARAGCTSLPKRASRKRRALRPIKAHRTGDPVSDCLDIREQLRFPESQHQPPGSLKLLGLVHRPLTIACDLVDPVVRIRTISELRPALLPVTPVAEVAVTEDDDPRAPENDVRLPRQILLREAGT